MKKICILAIILTSCLGMGWNAQAFTSSSIVLNQAPYTAFYRGTFDNLVLDFSIAVARPDVLKAVSLKNLGTANYLQHINNVVLWADAGPAGFQGMGVDRKLGTMSYSDTFSSWYLSGLNEHITDSEHFYVSVELFSDLSTAATIQMQIPQLADQNGNGSFDVGDLGIFMDSGDNGPSDAPLTNSNIQTISTTSVDNWPPKIVLTNLTDGQAINSNDYLIQGLVRDQGNTSIRDLSVVIDGTENPVANTNMGNYNWQFDWSNIIDGAHTVSVTAHDAIGNFSQTPTLNVTVQKQTVSAANSTVSIDKNLIKSDGLDKAVVAVVLKDAAGSPVANKSIAISADSSVMVTIANNNSDSQGNVTAEVRTTSAGTKTLTVSSDGQVLKTLTLTASSNVVAPTSPSGTFSYGDLIKASGQAIYYYGSDAKRYVFPNLATYKTWYPNFSGVVTINGATLGSVPIGGNVTYKPGVKLVKITTDPKVYAVGAHGTLHWLTSEAVAVALYGSNWGSLVEDVPDPFFINYTVGAPIYQASDFAPQAETSAATSIGVDKGL